MGWCRADIRGISPDPIDIWIRGRIKDQAGRTDSQMKKHAGDGIVSVIH